MKRIPLALAALGVSFAASLPAQVSLTGAVNAASYLNANLPNGKLAQGVLFIGFGKGMGPAKLAGVTAFPLPASLAGTSVSATVGSTTVQCIMIYTSAGQLAAVLPSDTPVGAGTMVVTYNGQSSAPLNITVVAHDFGIFALNQGGSGPGIFTEALTSVVNTTKASANPGDLVDIWGTGLGPVSGDEAGGPLPGDMPLDVKVFVGSQPAQVLYRGRSGCCTALDQIRIVIPQGISGCYVPIYVMVNGVISNFTTISIAESGSACPDPSTYSADLLQTAQKNGGLRVGSAALLHVHGFAGTTGYVTDSASMAFSKVSLSALQQATPTPEANTCYVVQFPGGAGVGTSPLAAGSITVSGPIGTYPLALVQPGAYQVAFAPSSPSFPGIVNDGTLLKPGDYTFTGTAGTDVGAFTVTVPFPSPLNWTNRPAAPVTISRSQDLTIKWTNGYPGALLQMQGQSSASISVGAAFTCWADATAGTFTIPVAILSALPATYVSDTVPQASLSVIQVYSGSQFSASGIDYGGTQFTDGYDMGAITYQ